MRDVADPIARRAAGDVVEDEVGSVLECVPVSFGQAYGTLGPTFPGYLPEASWQGHPQPLLSKATGSFRSLGAERCRVVIAAHREPAVDVRQLPSTMDHVAPVSRGVPACPDDEGHHEEAGPEGDRAVEGELQWRDLIVAAWSHRGKAKTMMEAWATACPRAALKGASAGTPSGFASPGYSLCSLREQDPAPDVTSLPLCPRTLRPW